MHVIRLHVHSIMTRKRVIDDSDCHASVQAVLTNWLLPPTPVGVLPQFACGEVDVGVGVMNATPVDSRVIHVSVQYQAVRRPRFLTSNSACDLGAGIHRNGSASVSFASAADSGSSVRDSGYESRDLVVGAGISEEDLVAALAGCNCSRLCVIW